MTAPVKRAGSLRPSARFYEQGTTDCGIGSGGPTLPITIVPCLFAIGIILLLVFFGAVIADIAVNHGSETLRFSLPLRDPNQALFIIHGFFESNGLTVLPGGCGLRASEGSNWLIGERVFEIAVMPEGPGLRVDCTCYMRMLFMPRMKLSKLGYLGIVGRRMGLARKLAFMDFMEVVRRNPPMQPMMQGMPMGSIAPMQALPQQQAMSPAQNPPR